MPFFFFEAYSFSNRISNCIPEVRSLEGQKSCSTDCEKLPEIKKEKERERDEEREKGREGQQPGLGV